MQQMSYFKTALHLQNAAEIKRPFFLSINILWFTRRPKQKSAKIKIKTAVVTSPVGRTSRFVWCSRNSRNRIHVDLWWHLLCEQDDLQERREVRRQRAAIGRWFRMGNVERCHRQVQNRLFFPWRPVSPFLRLQSRAEKSEHRRGDVQLQWGAVFQLHEAKKSHARKLVPTVPLEIAISDRLCLSLLFMRFLYWFLNTNYNTVFF